MDVQTLKDLGLDLAASKLDAKLVLKKKLALAYEHYRFIEPHVFVRFQEEIKKKTLLVKVACPLCKNNQKARSTCYYCQTTGAQEMVYDKLVFNKLKDYPEVPPADCLLDLRKAKDLACFDEFEVGKVEAQEVRPDPIIFGLINGCEDKFYITQWDDDVKIEDILNDGEG